MGWCLPDVRPLWRLWSAIWRGVAQIHRLPFDRLRANGDILKSCDFSAHAELVEASNWFGQQPVELRPYDGLSSSKSSLFKKVYKKFLEWAETMQQGAWTKENLPAKRMTRQRWIYRRQRKLFLVKAKLFFLQVWCKTLRIRSSVALNRSDGCSEEGEQKVLTVRSFTDIFRHLQVSMSFSNPLAFGLN